MESNNHPIVDCRQEIYPIYGSFRMREVLLPNEVVFTGFRNNNVTVRLLSCSAKPTQCAGSMCNKHNLYRNKRMESRCSCISNIQRMCPTTIIMQLLLQMNSGTEEMSINNFTSTGFVNNYVFMDRLAAHVRASHFSQDIEDDILDSTRRVFKYINDRGGFRIIGWAKRGMIQDHGAAFQQDNQGQRGGYGQPGNQANNNNMIKNVEVQYHIVRFDPSEPEAIDLEELNALKYTMGKGEN
jgi:hypothetical protein